jgi:hypothetical protein
MEHGTKGAMTNLIPNPFLIVAQREGEDRVTYLLGTALASGGASALISLLRALGADLPDATGPLDVEFQTAGPTSRPDARFEIPGRAVVLFENKVVPGILFEDQVRNHLDAFGSVRPSVPKILLAITPDSSPPSWWASCVGSHRGVLFVYGAWSTVAKWARHAAADDDQGELTRTLFDWMIDYLKQRSALMTPVATFTPEQLARVVRGAHSWLQDLEEHHAAQEALLSNVASGLRHAMGWSESEPWMKVASRWGETWTPVSTYLEFWWPTPKLRDMPSTHLYTEVYLDEHDGKIALRSGLLFENKVQVAAWYGHAQDVASRTFGDRYWDYRRGGA